VTDTLLGALALGDIGDWFPNTDPQWKGADSAIFLREAAKAVQERGWSIANLDCTIFAEQPKLAPWRKQIQDNLAKLLSISADQVNLKAKTGEKVGPIGRGESISADAVVLLYRDEPSE
jgi:2-C-methyl-D-erythritol 2,4-cyclodiphosphate synthase